MKINMYNATTNDPTIDFIFGCLKSETNIQIKYSILFFSWLTRNMTDF